MIWFVRGGKVESSCFYLHAIYFAMVSPIFPLGLMGFSPGQNPNTIFIITLLHSFIIIIWKSESYIMSHNLWHDLSTLDLDFLFKCSGQKAKAWLH